MKIRTIRKLTLNNPVPVYDIGVSNNPNFKLKNGPFVHNSKDISDAWGQVVHNAHINSSFLDDSLLGFSSDGGSDKMKIETVESLEDIVHSLNDWVRGVAKKKPKAPIQVKDEEIIIK